VGCDDAVVVGKKVPAPGAADFISRPTGTTYASRQGAARGCCRLAAVAMDGRRAQA